MNEFQMLFNGSKVSKASPGPNDLGQPGEYPPESINDPILYCVFLLISHFREL